MVSFLREKSEKVRAARACPARPSTCLVMENTTVTTPTLTLWDIEDIAAFYKRSVRQARRIVAEEGFPPHARGDRFRWVADHVVAYATLDWSPAAEEQDPTLMTKTAVTDKIVRTPRTYKNRMAA